MMSGKIILLLFSGCLGFAAHAQIRIDCDAEGSIRTVKGEPSANASWLQKSRADYLACSNNGNTPHNHDSQKQNPVAEFLHYQALSESCNRQRNRPPESGKLAVSYPWKGPNLALRAPNYSVEKMKRLIAISLAAGVDPNLAIVIALLESPPLLDTSPTQGYEYGYGDLPIDALPLFDSLGCLYRKMPEWRHSSPEEIAQAQRIFMQKARLKAELKKTRPALDKFYESLRNRSDYFRNQTTLLAEIQSALARGCPLQNLERELSDSVCENTEIREGLLTDAMVSRASLDEKAFFANLSEPKALKEAELRSKLDRSTVATIMASKTIKEMSTPWANADSPTKYLCSTTGPIQAGVPAWFSVVEKPEDHLCCVKVKGLVSDDNASKELRNSLALKFISKKIKLEPGPILSLANDIQMFNGRGRLGATESVNNDCFSGIDMAQRPLYGARAVDLLLNSVMVNVAIQNLISQASQEFYLPVSSVLCRKLGPGNHALSRTLFFDLQKRFLLGHEPERRKACSNRF